MRIRHRSQGIKVITTQHRESSGRTGASWSQDTADFLNETTRHYFPAIAIQGKPYYAGHGS